MKLISVQDLKNFLGDQIGSTQDDVLASFIEGISQRFETFLGRKLEQDTLTEYFEGGRKNFFLSNYPVSTAQSVGVTIEDVAKTQNTDFWVDNERGVVQFTSQVSQGDPRSIAIAYTGGFVKSKGVLEVPDDLKLACTMQTAFAFRRKRTLGVKGVNMPDGSVTINEPDALLKEVKEILKSYKRMTI